MQVGLDSVFMRSFMSSFTRSSTRSFLRSSISRRIRSSRQAGGVRLFHHDRNYNYNHNHNHNHNRNCNLNRADPSPPRPAATNARAISIMSAGGSAGYPGYAGYAWPATQPAYGLPLGRVNQANQVNPVDAVQQNPLLPVQPPLISDAVTQNPQAPPFLRKIQPSSRSPPPSPSPRAAEQRDKIRPPSLESGGVPDPTPEYLEAASRPPFRLPRPRSILVVIDLNGTLLHRPSRHSPTRFVERPFARPFVSYCVNTFTVVIWSSARAQNVANMCRQLLAPEDAAKVVAIWSRDHFGLSKNDFNQRVQCYKRLSALWADPVVAASHPDAADGEKWSQANTVLIDDSMEKARSEPFNLVQIPEFAGNTQEPGFVLPQVHDYLNECSWQADVSAYVKSQSFKIKPGFTL